MTRGGRGICSFHETITRILTVVKGSFKDGACLVAPVAARIETSGMIHGQEEDHEPTADEDIAREYSEAMRARRDADPGEGPPA